MRASTKWISEAHFRETQARGLTPLERRHIKRKEPHPVKDIGDRKVERPYFLV